MPFDASRRAVLLGGACCAAVAGLAPKLALAAVPTNKRLVLVILRGGLDGLSAAPAYGEPGYAAQRARLAIQSPIKLDGLFGLHPSMKNVASMYRNGEALVLHAACTPYRDRSHFDGQDVLESGADKVYGARDGWLNRALPALGFVNPQSAVAIAPQTPLVLRGDAPTTAWSPTRLPDVRPDTWSRLQDLYADDPVLSDALLRAVAAEETASGAMQGMRPARGGPAAFEAAARSAARFLTAENGARVAVLEVGGWDTHVNQGADDGALARLLGGLDAALAALKEDLHTTWNDTAVLVATEFGRTVAENGGRGTDHGVGGAAFLLGGAVKGGRVVADWPGLRIGDLFEGRDLRPTMDLRGAFKAALIDHLELGEAHVEKVVFPDSREARMTEGLFA